MAVTSPQNLSVISGRLRLRQRSVVDQLLFFRWSGTILYDLLQTTNNIQDLKAFGYWQQLLYFVLRYRTIQIHVCVSLNGAYHNGEHGLGALSPNGPCAFRVVPDQPMLFIFVMEMSQ